MSAMPGPGPSDAARVGQFLDTLRAHTGKLPIGANLETRANGNRPADRRRRARPGRQDRGLQGAGAERRGGPQDARTDEGVELRMERLLLSVAPEDLPAFKYALEYDLDYKDLEEYVFHDIDDSGRRLRMLDHLKRTPPSRGIKVLSDVDDTMYANLIDQRYSKGTLYPGVLDFYDAVKEELFGTGTPPRVHITTLSARPNPVAGKLEEAEPQEPGRQDEGTAVPERAVGINHVLDARHHRERPAGALAAPRGGGRATPRARTTIACSTACPVDRRTRSGAPSTRTSCGSRRSTRSIGTCSSAIRARPTPSPRSSCSPTRRRTPRPG